MQSEKIKKIKASFGSEPQDLQPEKESQEYDACRFRLYGYDIVFRSSKVTPSKTGQFVTIWKRSEQGPIAPLHEEDAFDFVVIHSVKDQESGFFIFPKTVLVQKHIVSNQIKEGKRGIRVYPSWDKVESKQAQKTQAWQRQYFLTKPKALATELQQLMEKCLNKSA